MWSLSKYLTVQGNAFPTIMKHLIYTVAITCSWGTTLEKLARISLSFTTLWIEDSFLLENSLSIYSSPPFLIKLRTFSFLLKGALDGFSLAYLNCQHHSSCIWGLILSKIRVTWTQALPGQSDDPGSYHVTHGQDGLTLPGGPGRTDWHSQEDQRGWTDTPRRTGEDGLTFPGGPKRMDWHSQEVSGGQHRISSRCSEWCTIENFWVISETLHIIFLDCGWPTAGS